MRKLSVETRAVVLRCLTDGMGVNATARTAGVSKGAVLRLLVEAGEFAAFFHDRMMRDLHIPRVEVDEQWSFIGAKRGRSQNPEYGDVWTYAALASDSKLVVSYLVGGRNDVCADRFIADLAGRLSQKSDKFGRMPVVQLTSDGWGGYLHPVSRHFDWNRVDYAQVIKEYENEATEDMRRYGPSRVKSVTKHRIIGTPDMDAATTSHMENLNLHTRQRVRRFARLTNAHSKIVENHVHAVALGFFAHNFIRVHSALGERGNKVTPAMAAGVINRPLTIMDLVEWMDPTIVTIR